MIYGIPFIQQKDKKLVTKMSNLVFRPCYSGIFCKTIGQAYYCIN